VVFLFNYINRFAIDFNVFFGNDFEISSNFCNGARSRGNTIWTDVWKKGRNGIIISKVIGCDGAERGYRKVKCFKVELKCIFVDGKPCRRSWAQMPCIGIC
jgi:hypothetical protein